MNVFEGKPIVIPLRDGIFLAARCWFADSLPAPVLLYRTPYGAKEEAREHQSMIRAALVRGMSVVIQDVRGRYESEGIFVPYRQEGPDGFDTIEWLARQTWCNGRVGMFGLSYPAATQWLAAIEAPPALQAMVPAMCFSRPDHFFSISGAFDLSWSYWTASFIVEEERRRRGQPALEANVIEASMRPPLAEARTLIEALPSYGDWLTYEPGDPWWSWCDIQSRIRNVSAAVLNLSGWHDEAYGPVGAIENFVALQRIRGDDGTVELVLGPWSHGVDTFQSEVVGDRYLGSTAIVDYDTLVLDFLQKHLFNTSPEPKAAVRAYIMGANTWISGQQWPLPHTIETWFLDAGKLTPTPNSIAGSVAFVSNPETHPVGPSDLSYGSYDVSAWTHRPDVLTFDTLPLVAPIDVIGAIRTTLIVNCSAPSFDLYAWILDVKPDGSAWTLTSPGNAFCRAAGSGQHEIRFEHHVTGQRFEAGHRLRLVVLGGLQGALAPNPQSGHSEKYFWDPIPATITILYGGRVQSRIELPVINRKE